LSLVNLPDELTPEQLEAWIRLSALLDDEGLLETLRLQHAPFADVAADDKREAFGREIVAIQREAVALLGTPPEDESVHLLLDRWMNVFAEALGLKDDPHFPEWFLAYAERSNDPRIERFWNELAILRGWPKMSPMTQANTLLLTALKQRLQ